MDEREREEIREKKRTQRGQERNAARATAGRQMPQQRGAALQAAVMWYKGKDEAELLQVADRFLGWVAKSDAG